MDHCSNIGNRMADRFFCLPKFGWYNSHCFSDSGNFNYLQTGNRPKGVVLFGFEIIIIENSPFTWGILFY